MKQLTQLLRIAILGVASSCGYAMATPVAVGQTVSHVGFTYASPDPSTVDDSRKIPPGRYDPSLAGPVLYDKLSRLTVLVGATFASPVVLTLEDRVVRNAFGTLDFYSLIDADDPLALYAGPYFERRNQAPVFDAVDMGARSELGGSRPTIDVSRPNASSFVFRSADLFARGSLGVAYYRSTATAFDLGAAGSIRVATGPSSSGSLDLIGLAQPSAVPEPSSLALAAVGIVGLVAFAARQRRT